MRRALLVVALALVLAAMPTSPAGAQRETGRIMLAGQTPWVRPDGPFQLRVLVDRVRETADLEVAVAVHRAIRTRSQFQRTLDGDLLGRAVRSYVRPLGALRFGPNGALLTVELPPLDAGVYPVSVALRSPRGAVVDAFTTHLVKLPDEPVEVPLQVAWIQPVRAVPTLRPGGERVLADDDLDRIRALAAAVAAAPATPLVLDVSPELLEALEAGGHDDVLALLTARDVLAAPYVDVDAAALVAAGLGDSLAHQRTTGEEVLDRLLGDSSDSRTWSLDDAFDPRTIGELRALGVSRVVVDERALEPLDPGVTAGLTLARPFALADGRGGTVDAAAVDPGLVAHLEHDEPVLGAHHLLADLAVLFFDAPGTPHGVVIRPPEGLTADEELLRIVLPALAAGTHPIVRPVTPGELFSLDALTDDGEVVVREPGARVDRLAVAPADIRAARDAVAAFAVLVGDDHESLPLLHRLLLVAEAESLPAEVRRLLLGAISEEVEGVRADVRLVAGRTFRLTAREGTIPITIVNDNPFPISATLVLASDKLEFAGAPEDDRGRLVIDDVLLQPGTTTRTVPVKVRTSGSFPLRARLLDAGATTELFRASYTVTSTVTSGVGLVLSGGALGFLLLWWASHWRTVRRDRRLVEVAG